MTLPFQVPRISATKHLKAHEFDAAAQCIDEFFRKLDSDPSATAVREEHSRRQIFEADFLSTLTPEEIDGWYILALCRLSTGKVEDARNACYKQLELIDEFYGYATPSWKHIETRIPMHEELVKRYANAAALLSDIFAHQGRQDLAERWNKVSQSALSDRHQPDQVWERWLSDGSGGNPVGSRDWFELISWPITPIEIDGQKWLSQINGTLARSASPLDFPTLFTVSIPTEPESDIPSKQLRWKIWSLRQALNAAVIRNRAGVLAGEAQTRGMRVLFFYLADLDEATIQIVEPILNAASELNAQFDVQDDPNWQEYVKWGGEPVSPQAPEVVSLPEPEPGDVESLEDKLFRAAWNIAASCNDSWVRFYNLIWLIGGMPPSKKNVRDFCIEYLRNAAQQLSPAKRVDGAMYLVWKFPKVDKQAAIDAFEELQQIGFPTSEENQSTLNLAAEGLAQVDPRRAYVICQALENYSLVWRCWVEIAKTAAHEDPAWARELILRACEFLRSEGGEDKAYFIARDLAAVAEKLPAELSDMLPEIFREAESFADKIDSATMKSDMFYELACQAKVSAPQQLKSLCEKAAAAARVRADANLNQSFGDRCGPYEASKMLARTAPLVASYDRLKAAMLFDEALDHAMARGDLWGHFETLTEMASAIGESKVRTAPMLANKLWKLLGPCAPHAVNLPDPYILASNVTLRKGLQESIKAFVTMEPSVASEQFDTIEAICESAKLPELRIKLLCKFATHLGATNKEQGRALLTRAEALVPKCSSSYLQAIGLAQIIAAAAVCGLQIGNYQKQLLDELRRVPGDIRYELVLELALLISGSDEECARQLLAALDTDAMSADITISGPLAIGRLNEIPATVSGDLHLRWLRYVHPSEFIGALGQWQSKYKQINQRQ